MDRQNCLPQSDSRPRRRRWFASSWLPLAAFAALLFLTLPGCGGCSQSPDPDETAEADKDKAAKKKKEKKKPDFESKPLITLPGTLEGIRYVKPGHWVSGVQSLKANNFDFSGDLIATLNDGSGNPVPLEGTPYHMTSTRPAPAGKGAQKNLETLFYIPSGARQVRPNFRINERGGGREIPLDTPALQLMPEYQYHFLVLAREPETYKGLDRLRTVRLSHGEEMIDHYRVVRPPANQPIALPSHSLAWTSTAVVLWDRYDIQKIVEPEQRQAMLDWLHWGGKLIISGPDSLDDLKTSFLESYLPATAGEAISINEAQLEPLNRVWANAASPERRLTLVRPWSGVSLKLHSEARMVPDTGDLVATRRIGRGSITATAFRLSERRLLQWAEFDGFLNNYLLGRPPREFGVDNQMLTVRWKDSRRPSVLDPRIVTDVSNDSQSRSVLDPRLVTDVSYFARDAATQFTAPQPVRPDFENGYYNPRVDYYAPSEETPIPRSGVAGWNDNSPVAKAVGTSLREASGIDVPKPAFVVWVLGVYLLVLVPLNWIVFRLIGRVEWAWIAAPFIAIVCAVAVVRLAQLDIGFVRSKTELAVVEAHAGYPRAHVARFTALYSSLSTSYRASYADSTAVAQPFAHGDFNLLRGQSRSAVTYERDHDVGLSGFNVASNSTAILHSEQMLDLGGDITLSGEGLRGLKLANNSKMRLRGAGIVGRLEGDVQIALPLGDIAPQTERTVDLAFAPGQQTTTDWDDGIASLLTGRSARLRMAGVAKIARDTSLMQPGQVDLVAWLDEELPGEEIEPRASQSRNLGLIVVHLRYARRAAPQPDVNSRLNVPWKANDDDAPLVEPPAEEPETVNLGSS